MDIQPIKNALGHAAALAEIEALMCAKRDTPEGDRLDVLVTLVQAYETKHHPIDPPDPINRVYEVLARKRPLTLNMIRRLTKGLSTAARLALLTQDSRGVSLENPDEHAIAERDPRAFLNRFASGAILDEVQRCPHLLPWLQGLVDERGRTGDFVLTGSSQFDPIAGITQSLAGRVRRIALLPLTADELAAVGKLPSTLEDFLLCGSYPALYDRELSPGDWFPNYVSTYLERDVRQLVAEVACARGVAGREAWGAAPAALSGQGLIERALQLADAARHVQGADVAAVGAEQHHRAVLRAVSPGKGSTLGQLQVRHQKVHAARVVATQVVHQLHHRGAAKVAVVVGQHQRGCASADACQVGRVTGARQLLPDGASNRHHGQQDEKPAQPGAARRTNGEGRTGIHGWSVGVR